MIAVRALLSVLALPFVVTLVIPCTIVALQGGRAALTPAQPAVAAISGGVIGFGALFAVWTIVLFAVDGRGTLAPWDPPRKLVIRGPYKLVRNPMIFGVSTVLLGETILLSSPAIGALWALFLLANRIYIPLFEEPGLLRRFGADEYLEYTRSVPRWIPRLRAWQPGTPPGRVYPSDQMIPDFEPGDRLRARLVIGAAQTVFVGVLASLLLIASGVAEASWYWALPLLFLAWAMLDLVDAWCDDFRPFPPPVAHARVHADRGDALEFRLIDSPIDFAVVNVVQAPKGTFVMRRRTLISRGLARRLRRRPVPPLRVALRFEPRGRPDEDGFLRFVATAAYDEPPGAWTAHAETRDA